MACWQMQKNNIKKKNKIRERCMYTRKVKGAVDGNKCFNQMFDITSKDEEKRKKN